MAGFGSDCGIGDIQAVAKANELCNRYTLDTISTSATIAFAMECFEHGLIGPAETGGLDLRFGNADAMLAVVELIARREGIGDLLAEGSRRAAQVIGGDAPHFAIQVKGQELSMHDPRGKVGVGLGFAISDTGADHLVAFHDTALQNAESVSFRGRGAARHHRRLAGPRPERQKVANYAIGENWSSAEKVLGLCYFGPAPRSFIQVEEVLAAVHAATGWELGVEDLLRLGERATNLARAFNVREGLSREDDTLPDRLFEPLEGGALTGVAISRPDFERAMTDLYRPEGLGSGHRGADARTPGRAGDRVGRRPVRIVVDASAPGWTSQLVRCRQAYLARLALGGAHATHRLPGGAGCAGRGGRHRRGEPAGSHRGRPAACRR